jgi:cholesterol oxidase
VIGIVRTPDLEPARQRWTVSDGTLDVLIDDPRSVDTKLLVYRLTLTADDGTKRWLRGHKVVNLATLRRHFWSSLTRVPFVIFDVEPTERLKRDRQNIWRLVEKWDSKGGAAPKGTCGAGAMRSTVTDAMRLGLSIRIVRERSLWKRLRWRYRFTWWFAKTVIQLRVWALRTTRSINPFDPDELKKSYVDRGLFGKEINYPRDNPRMRLTQYWGTSKTPPTRPPVILAPGFGMSTLCFHSAGENSFAQYLRTKGYDVWLFDYRASDKLDVSLDQFDIDQLAHDDFPRAIEEVFGCTKRPVHIVAHCLASMIMQMSLLAGKIETEHVRSMLLSQSFAFIDLPWPTRLKVRLHLPELLQYMNSRPVVTSDFDRRSTFGTRLLDRLLYFFPSDERCHEGVCRRLLLLYGEVVRHDHLDQATHESFYHLFDRGNLSAFKHIGRMFILGHIADKNGNNIYLDPKNGPNVNVPITLLQGTANRMFLPSGARKTLHWLRQHGASDLPVDKHKLFTLEHTDGYGHLDNFIGKNAKRDVFPTIVAALERMNGTPSRCVWWSS